MKYIVIILTLLLTAARAVSSDIDLLKRISSAKIVVMGQPAALRNLSSFVVMTQINSNQKDINVLPDASDFEYYVIQKLQKEGMEAINMGQVQFEGKPRESFFNVDIVIHYDPDLSKRAYFDVSIYVLRTCAFPDLSIMLDSIVYRQGCFGACHIDDIKQHIKTLLDSVISPFLADWRSVNKYIQTPAGGRFILSSTNDPYAGLGVEDK